MPWGDYRSNDPSTISTTPHPDHVAFHESRKAQERTQRDRQEKQRARQESRDRVLNDCRNAVSQIRRLFA